MQVQNQLRAVSPSATRMTADQMLGEIGELAPEISTRAAEIEAGRRMPLDLVDALRSIGVFRMFVPRSHGGLALELPTGLDIIAALAPQADEHREFRDRGVAAVRGEARAPVVASCSCGGGGSRVVVPVPDVSRSGRLERDSG